MIYRRHEAKPADDVGRPGRCQAMGGYIMVVAPIVFIRISVMIFPPNAVAPRTRPLSQILTPAASPKSSRPNDAPDDTKRSAW